MQAKELRIGNLIYGVSDRIEEVCQIKNLALTTKTIGFDDQYTCEIEYFNPITLSEEWLTNFGFIQSMELTNYWSVCEQMNIVIDSDEIHYALPLDGDGNFGKIKKINYVHELQNLYFALTGQELTIKS